MKLVEIAPQRKKLDLADWKKRTAMEEDYDTLIKDDTLIRDQAGNPILLYVKPKIDFASLRSALTKIEYQASERTGGLKTVSRVFGYQPRIALRRDFCTATSLAYSSPKTNEIICDFGRGIDPIYRKYFPSTAEHHNEQTTKVLPEWRIPGTVFTSGIINKNNPLKYHFDAGNFENVCSCMLGFKRNILGGYLSIPEFGLALEIADGSLTIFDGQSLLHGVTPIKRTTPDAYRYTVVYYALKDMWKCEPVGVELERIRRLRTEREFRRAGMATSVQTPKVGEEIYVDQNGIITEAGKKE